MLSEKNICYSLRGRGGAGHLVFNLKKNLNKFVLRPPHIFYKHLRSVYPIQPCCFLYVIGQFELLSFVRTLCCPCFPGPGFFTALVVALPHCAPTESSSFILLRCTSRFSCTFSGFLSKGCPCSCSLMTVFFILCLFAILKTLRTSFQCFVIMILYFLSVPSFCSQM